MGCSYSVSIDAGLPSRLSLLTQTKSTTTSPILHTWSSKIRRVVFDHGPTLVVLTVIFAVWSWPGP